jgi:hypothetical protein
LKQRWTHFKTRLHVRVISRNDRCLIVFCWRGWHDKKTRLKSNAQNILKHCLGKEVKRKGQGKHLRSCAGGRFCMGKHEKFLRDVPNLSFCTNFFM